MTSSTQPQRRVTTEYTEGTWQIRCADCDESLVIDFKPVDINLWEHALQAHACNANYFDAADRERHARRCGLNHD